MDDDIRNRFRGQSIQKEPVTVPLRQPEPLQTTTQPTKPPMRSAPVDPLTSSTPVTPKKSFKRPKKRLPVTIIIVCVLLLSAIGVLYVYKKSHKLQNSTPSPVNKAAVSNPSIPQKSEKIRLIVSGDSIAYDSINQNAKKSDGHYDYSSMLSSIKPLLSKGDIRICNQASPAGGDQFGITGSPIFNGPSDFSQSFIQEGCNVINLASPNMNDKGQPVIDATRKNFDNQSSILAVSGANRSNAEQKNIPYFTVKGLKFAYLSYTTQSLNKQISPFGVNLYSTDLVDSQVAEAKTKAAIIIVGMHWGVEYSPDISAEQEQIAQHLTSLGVDIVLGSGPHVIEPVKVLNGANNHQTLVWFSLGNFLHSQVPTETKIGAVAVMDIDSNSQQLLNPRCLPIYMHYDWTVEQKQRQTPADLAARHNFLIVPLDQAAQLYANSNEPTTLQQQRNRIDGIVNKYFKVPLITSADF
ncbi:MAG: hypothetical protein NVSMB46_00460 [Candidatus Saccharimonadales bacterium]